MREWMAFVISGALCAAVQAADPPLAWPRFRGPNGSGVAENQKPPAELGPEINVKWKISAPGGLSSPIIAGDFLIITAFDGGKLSTIAYRREDGKEAWRADAPAAQIEPFLKGEGSPAASTSATDGRRIVSYFGSSGLFCLDLSGKELWRIPMQTATVGGGFGSGTSPIFVDGAVILVRDEKKDARILSIDAATGKPRWEKKRESSTSWCSPLEWRAPPGLQIVTAGHGRMIGYELESGNEVWTLPGMPAGCCASPVVSDGTLFFAGWSPGGPDDKDFKMPTFDEQLKTLDADHDGALSFAEADKAYNGFFSSQDSNGDGKIVRDEYEALYRFVMEGMNSAFAVKPGGKGDVSRSHVLWRKTRGLPYVATPIAYGGQLVLVKDGGIVTAYDVRTGDEVYAERAVANGKYYASPVGASGRIYFVSLEDGAVTVIRAGARKPEVIARNPPLGERVGATPAIADDAIYIRTEKHLYAFASKN